MQGPQQIADTNDILLAQAGDRAAFGRLMDAYLPLAYRLSLRWLASADDAKDACQEAFVRVWEHLGAYDVRRPMAAWLTTIVTRICLDRLRRRRRSPFTWFNPDRSTSTEPLQAGPDPQQVAIWSDLASIVVGLMKRLPPTQRVVFALRDLEDLDVDDVAQITGLSISSVKTNLSYARRTIRTILTTEYQQKDMVV